ncbi:uncharacterized protein LOC123804404 isoform X2 [Phyllostomus hastatus]|uniref:uncharacterized protein LOC123804404 isoform X2 n=1 Tax=Phyllostomus hastatus TaxID=9423 RepID=UPI001E681B0D|nr:uncharacterized protein LOC123804404 isoform X2 [Phyllostomus hastatus]
MVEQNSKRTRLWRERVTRTPIAARRVASRRNTAPGVHAHRSRPRLLTCMSPAAALRRRLCRSHFLPPCPGPCCPGCVSTRGGRGTAGTQTLQRCCRALPVWPFSAAPPPRPPERQEGHFSRTRGSSEAGICENAAARTGEDRRGPPGRGCGLSWGRRTGRRRGQELARGWRRKLSPPQLRTRERRPSHLVTKVTHARRGKLGKYRRN